MLQIKILDKRLGTEFKMPTYATVGSAGMDLIACMIEPIILEPNKSILVSTGMSIYLRDPDLAAILLPRSGLGAKHGIVLGNLVGLIDSDYTGPLMVSLWNRGEKPFTVKPGMRISQMVIIRVLHPAMEIVEEFDLFDESGNRVEEVRGEGGFGSTGE